MAKKPNISAAMREVWATYTPEQRRADSQRKSDAAVCRLWTKAKHQPGKGNRQGRKPGARNNMDPNTRIGNTTLAKVMRSSIKSIMQDLAHTQPDLFRNALIDGLLSAPPRSFPYLSLCAAYLDGKPVDAEPPLQAIADLSALSRDELRARAERLVHALKSDTTATGLPVIDVEPVEERELTLDELQEQMRLAQLELDQANAEAAKAKAEVLKANADVITAVRARRGMESV